jgi:hypothetical protein
MEPSYNSREGKLRVLRICLCLALVATASGQDRDNRLRFEVASVKASAKQGMITRKEGGPGTSDPGLVRITNAELAMLVMYAYGIQEDQLKRPPWMART